MSDLICYVDGGFYRHYSLGAWAVVFYLNSDFLNETHGLQENATSAEQMELIAILKALEAVEPGSDVTIFTDCQNIKEKAEWLRDEGILPYGNLKLWQRLQGLMAQRTVTLKLVTGHSDCEPNNRAHRLCDWQLQAGTRK